MQKLNFYGIGPRIGIIALPWLAVAIILSLIYKGAFRFSAGNDKVLFYVGLVLLILGLVMYFSTIPLLLKGIRDTRLVTNGSFYLCCNPLYAAIILFMIPGASLMMNSWLVLTASVVAYVIFKMNIKKEQQEMEKFFGENYTSYRSLTPEFFPVPLKKIFRF
jgi:protein-S-isoprenylcysteine O-methyltransferase Ste14